MPRAPVRERECQPLSILDQDRLDRRFQPDRAIERSGKVVAEEGETALGIDVPNVRAFRLLPRVPICHGASSQTARDLQADHMDGPSVHLRRDHRGG